MNDTLCRVEGCGCEEYAEALSRAHDMCVCHHPKASHNRTEATFDAVSWLRSQCVNKEYRKHNPMVLPCCNFCRAADEIKRLLAVKRLIKRYSAGRDKSGYQYAHYTILLDELSHAIGESV